MDPIFIAISFILAKSQPLLVALGLGSSVMGIQLAAIFAIALSLIAVSAGIIGLTIYSIRKINTPSPIEEGLENPEELENSEVEAPNLEEEWDLPPPVYNGEKEGPDLPPAYDSEEEGLLPEVPKVDEPVLTKKKLKAIIESHFTDDKNSALEPFFDKIALSEYEDDDDSYIPGSSPSRNQLREPIKNILGHLITAVKTEEISKKELDGLLKPYCYQIKGLGERYYNPVAGLGDEVWNIMQKACFPSVEFTPRGPQRAKN